MAAGTSRRVVGSLDGSGGKGGVSAPSASLSGRSTKASKPLAMVHGTFGTIRGPGVSTAADANAAESPAADAALTTERATRAARTRVEDDPSRRWEQTTHPRHVTSVHGRYVPKGEPAPRRVLGATPCAIGAARALPGPRPGGVGGPR